jgi:hypothetical protein
VTTLQTGAAEREAPSARPRVVLPALCATQITGYGVPVAVAGVAARTRPAPADPHRLRGEVLVQLRLQGRLHQVLGQPRQQPALTHQPQPAGLDLPGRQRRQPRQQFLVEAELLIRDLHLGCVDQRGVTRNRLLDA